ncbi:hypothetical protein IA54_016115 [Xanthomonas phaseoli pv. syngonii LMG 9055]|uniref:Uncharacterized protein n=1 Tax=Xanthomonas phaseoli pv. syngonii LMG 9055 TaxID=1437878 RepID=A0A1V9GJ65_9XANT|nr:hypothetical protein IA54_016115 [Xanthomonas phaseoli pv. syngonii LMG 9055]
MSEFLLPLKAVQNNQFNWSLPAHRRGTGGGMDDATELTWMYLQRVLRWWAGRALQQTQRP